MSRPPLTGLRVLDVSHNLAGPLTAMHLGDLGAEVVKVEGPAGDDWRDHERIPGHPGRSRHHLQLNRNKRAVCLDLRRPEAREVMNDLSRADVLVTNLRPGVPERLGFGWEDARALNPALVYCAISAFGAAAPSRAGRATTSRRRRSRGSWPGPTTASRSRSGAGDRHRPAAAGVRGDPRRAGLARATGRGQLVDASLLGTAVALNAYSLVRIDDLPEHGVRTSRAPSSGPTAPRTAGSWSPPTPSASPGASARRSGCPACSTSPPGTTGRCARSARPSSSPWSPRGCASAPAPIGSAGSPTPACPPHPVRERDELFDDPDARAAGLLAAAHDPDLGALTMTAPVLRLSETPGAIRYPGRRLGQDTRAVLRETGRTDEQIDRLVNAGAAVCEPDAMRRRVVAHGRVQGVFFRESLRRLAAELGVAGYARNLPDGTLEAAFEGPEDAVREMVAFAHVGPPDADVSGSTSWRNHPPASRDSRSREHEAASGPEAHGLGLLARSPKVTL